jgi:transcriptional regulator with XRE-family HTH domain
METARREPRLAVDIVSEKASLMTSACRHDNSNRGRHATPNSDMKTFGELIAEGRKRAKPTQREFAARIKMEDGRPISTPYLNDLEHNLRHPPRGYLIEQFAKELNLETDLLYFVAGKCRPIFSPRRPARSRCSPPIALSARSSRPRGRSDERGRYRNFGTDTRHNRPLPPPFLVYTQAYLDARCEQILFEFLTELYGQITVPCRPARSLN